MKVILLAQIHASPDSELDFESISFKRAVQSQFSIAKHLQQRQNAFVINEGTLGIDEYDAEKHFQNYSLIFPDGIPEEETNLNDLQKKLFYLVGGAGIVLASGHINRLYGVSSQHINLIKKCMGGQDVAVDELNSFMFDREIEVINIVQEIVAKEHSAEIIIVFGANHDFAYYCEKLGYEYERIETDQASPIETIIRETYASFRSSYLSGHEEPFVNQDEAFISSAVVQFNLMYDNSPARKACVNYIVPLLNLNTPTRINQLIEVILNLCAHSAAREVMLTELYESENLDPIYTARYHQQSETAISNLAPTEESIEISQNHSELKSGITSSFAPRFFGLKNRSGDPMELSIDRQSLGHS